MSSFNWFITNVVYFMAGLGLVSLLALFFCVVTRNIAIKFRTVENVVSVIRKLATITLFLFVVSACMKYIFL